MSKSFVTPVGTAIWPKLNVPDTKWKPEGEYSVKLRLTGEDADKLRTMIDQAIEENFKKVQAENKKKTIKKAASTPYQEVRDDDGNPTGEFDFAFKLKAKVKNAKTGAEVTLKPVLVDAKKTPTNAEVWSGSRIRVSGSLNPYHTASIGAGVSLRLQAVQIIELKTGMGRGADAFTSMEGYVAEVGEGNDETPAHGDVSAATKMLAENGVSPANGSDF